MKNIFYLYRQNPIFALLVNCVGFFLWAMTMVFIMVIMAVAFTR